MYQPLHEVPYSTEGSNTTRWQRQIPHLRLHPSHHASWGCWPESSYTRQCPEALRFRGQTLAPRWPAPANRHPEVEILLCKDGHPPRQA